MFYSERMDASLLLGDVIHGYILTPNTIFKPDLAVTQLKNTSITEVPVFSVVLTPCSSIDNGLLCLTLLEPIDSSFYKSLDMGKDFTVINHMNKPELLNYFIYEPSDILLNNMPVYSGIGYYKIDFSNITTIKASSIDRAKQESELVKSKCLQLSDSIREELNQKLSLYYKVKA